LLIDAALTASLNITPSYKLCL